MCSSCVTTSDTYSEKITQNSTVRFLELDTRDMVTHNFRCTDITSLHEQDGNSDWVDNRQHSRCVQSCGAPKSVPKSASLIG
jgi:hypothetical protein